MRRPGSKTLQTCQDAVIRILAGLILLALLIPAPGICGDLEEKLDFSLPMPAGENDQQYLGLSGTNPFTLGQIKADLVIIEIFSMYCPICQREAKNVNALFERIQSDPKLKDRIKLIGIGAGNSAFEVDFFKDTYSIGFPLFSDTDFTIHKQIGQVRTPHFFGLTLKKDHAFDVFYSQSGEMKDPGSFLTTLIDQSGIKLP